MIYIIWPTMAELIKEKQQIETKIIEISKKDNFRLIPIETKNWNDELSPWSFEDKKNHFAGNAKSFLEKVLSIINTLHCNENDKLCIGGYSLAGLFSLWAASQITIFDGVVSCSGSLWFPGFVTTQNIPNCKIVYLSLGDKESATRHILMSRVETITKEYFEILNSSNSYDKVTFELNHGNHFENVIERIAKGFAYISTYLN